MKSCDFSKRELNKNSLTIANKTKGDPTTFNRMVLGSSPSRPTTSLRHRFCSTGSACRRYFGFMRTPLLALPALLLLGGCLTTPADGSTKIQTTAEAKRENIQGAMAAPLRDVNVLRTKIPSVLLEATADPYKRPSPNTCAGITAAIVPLDGALGADLDEPAVDEDDVMERGQKTALGAVATLSSSVIPFRGWIRQLSGAERHDSVVQAAILAGAVRRAYLKGLGESKGCKPPATPSHMLTGSPVPTQGLKPRYPVR